MSVVAVEADERILSQVNHAFDTARARLGLRTDRDLAQHLGVSQKTLSFWRNGRWTDNDRALFGVICNPELQPVAA